MLEPHSTEAHRPHYVPRASLLVGPGDLPDLEAEIWMGGAHSHVGEPFHPQQLHNACVIECAGDLPAHYEPATRLWIPSIFIDIEGRPVRFERLLELAAQVADAARGRGTDAVDAVYSICTHGMNRSGLMAGLVLRELGMGGSQVVELITATRIGSLSNLSFRRILLEASV
jgi:hypothetical protein